VHNRFPNGFPNKEGLQTGTQRFKEPVASPKVDGKDGHLATQRPFPVLLSA